MEAEKPIRIFGRLKDLLNTPTPTRPNLLFVMGTLKHKMKLSDEKILDIIKDHNVWDMYSLEKAEFYLTKKPKQRGVFFSSSKQVKKWQLPDKKGWIRTLANNEIALDLDTKSDFKRAVHLFDEYELKGNCRTWQGSNGGHVSLFFNQPVTSSLRNMVRGFFNGDPGQTNISVEGMPHQKTGNVVQVIKERKGHNSFGSVTKMIEIECPGSQISDNEFFHSIRSVYGKSEKHLALENDIVDYWKDKLTQIEVFERLDFHKKKGDIMIPTHGYWGVL
jgi:hypothetical protein